jgi:hypothetical protein
MKFLVRNFCFKNFILQNIISVRTILLGEKRRIQEAQRHTDPEHFFPRYFMGLVLSNMYKCAVTTDSVSSYMAAYFSSSLNLFPTWPPTKFGRHYVKCFPRPFKS